MSFHKEPSQQRDKSLPPECCRWLVLGRWVPFLLEVLRGKPQGAPPVWGSSLTDPSLQFAAVQFLQFLSFALVLCGFFPSFIHYRSPSSHIFPATLPASSPSFGKGSWKIRASLGIQVRVVIFLPGIRPTDTPAAGSIGRRRASRRSSRAQRRWSLRLQRPCGVWGLDL